MMCLHILLGMERGNSRTELGIIIGKCYGGLLAETVQAQFSKQIESLTCEYLLTTSLLTTLGLVQVLVFRTTTYN